MDAATTMDLAAYNIGDGSERCWRVSGLAFPSEADLQRAHVEALGINFELTHGVTHKPGSCGKCDGVRARAGMVTL